jgi:hypothetical protein
VFRPFQCNSGFRVSLNPFGTSQGYACIEVRCVYVGGGGVCMGEWAAFTFFLQGERAPVFRTDVWAIVDGEVSAIFEG